MILFKSLSVYQRTNKTLKIMKVIIERHTIIIGDKSNVQDILE